MMKLNRHIWLLVALLGSFVACKEDDTEVSTITSFEKFSLTLPAPITVGEADATHEIHFTLPGAQIVDVNLEVAVAESSTATEHEDFDLEAHEIFVNALAGGGTIAIAIHSDVEQEGDETVVLSIHSLDLHGLPLPVESLVLTIRDSIYPASIVLDWEGEYQDSAGTQSLCDNFDIDLFLADDTGAFVGGFAGASAACPETMRAGVPDGTYSIVANLWANGALGSPDLVESPIHFQVRMYRDPLVNDANSTIRFNTSDFPQFTPWTTFTPSDEAGAFLLVVGRVRVQGGQYTLIDPAGNDVGTL